MFSFEYFEIFKNSYFTEHLRATRLLILEISADVANHVCKIQYVRDRVAHMKATRQRDFDYYIRLDMYVRRTSSTS